MNGGCIPWNITAIYETFKISCLMGRHPMKGCSAHHLTDQIYRLEQWMNDILFLLIAEDPSTPHQFDPKVLSSIFLGCMLSAKVIWKGDIMDADIEELEEMDVSELHVWRLNVREVLTSMKDEFFILSIADPTVKISGGHQDLRTSFLIKDSPDRGEEQDNLQRESDGSSSIPRQDSSWYDEEVQNDFLSTSGDFIYCHCESNCTCRLKILLCSIEIHCRYQNY